MNAKRGFALGLAATCLILMPACGNTPQSSNTNIEPSSTVVQLREFTAEDLKSICSIPEIYIIQGATEVELSKVFTFDPSMILNFELSPPEIDTSIESSLSIKVTVTVDQQVLAQKLGLDQADSYSSTTQIDLSGRINIVSSSRADEILATNQNAIILDSNNAPYSTAKAEVQLVNEAAEIPSIQNTDSNTGGNSAGNTGGSTGNTGSTGGGSTSGSTGNTGSTGGGSTGGSTGNTGSTGGGSTSGSTGNTGSTGGRPTSGNAGSTGGNHSGTTGESTGTNGGGTTGGSTGSTSSGATGGNTGTTGGGTTGGSTGGTSGGSGGEEKPVHTHSWEPIYETVHHDEVGHYESKVVTAAWDEPIYESRAICNNCGADVTSDSSYELHLIETGHSSYTVKKVQVDTIHHDAVTQDVWVVDQAAYDEQVITGYRCACGATK